MHRRGFPRNTSRDSSPSHGVPGSYNSGSGAPQLGSLEAGFSRAEGRNRGSGALDTTQPALMAGIASRGGKSSRTDPFVMSVAALVDEATEPGITEEEAERYREKLVNIVTGRESKQLNLPPSMSGVTGGQAVEFAIRKRLKSESETAVLNTITLLDELMRTCPYFYRYIANEKFFRRLWRFVVPDYKNSVKSMIPIFGKQKLNPGIRSDSEVPHRILVLIRAWAEEMSVMFDGRYDQHAGFLIERYNNKRQQIRFPAVPKTPNSLPWVCPIKPGTAGASRGSSSHRSSSGSGSDMISLAEAENTISLFSNLVDNAESISDLKEELCKDLASRCLYIQQNLTRLSMRMSKEDELARAIAISESLERILNKYTNSLERGSVTRAETVAERTSLQSEDEGYEEANRERRSLSSVGHHDIGLRRAASQRTESSEYSSGPRDEWAVRHGDIGRSERSRYDYNDDPELGRSHERRTSEERERYRQLDRERTQQRLRSDEGSFSRHASRSREGTKSTSVGNRRDKATSRSKGRDHSPNYPKPDVVDDESESESMENLETLRTTKVRAKQRKAGKSDGDLPSLSSRKAYRDGAERKGQRELVNITDGPISDSSEEEQGNDDSFAMLAQRYASVGITQEEHPSSSSRSKSKMRATSRSEKSLSKRQAEGRDSVQRQPSATLGTQNAFVPGMYSSTTPGAMPFSPMIVMPNPYTLYGSVGHMPMADPMSMYGAYQTVNPSMFYGSVNPGVVPGLAQAAGFQPANLGAAPVQMQPAESQTQQQPSNPNPLVVAQDSYSSAKHVPNPQEDVSSSKGPPREQQGLLQSPEQSQPSSTFGYGPTMVPMGSVYGGTLGTQNMVGLPPVQSPQAGNDMQVSQAAMYHSAMQQAAVAYHAAASAYHSISGHAPLGAPTTTAENVQQGPQERSQGIVDEGNETAAGHSR